jgi:hypothetical protein
MRWRFSATYRGTNRRHLHRRRRAGLQERDEGDASVTKRRNHPFGRAACLLAALALTAGAAAACGDDDEPAPTGADAQPDTYVPAPPTRPVPTRDLCDHPGARDAGNATPSAGDPRTLVLRLGDLPDGASFSEPGGVAELLHEGDVRELLRAAGLEAAARGQFRIGRREPERPPGAPPPPESCLPRTGVDAAALVFDDEDGARSAQADAERIAGSSVGAGIGPVEARARVSEGPFDVGEEAVLIVAPTDREGTVNRTIVWREGRLIGLVKVEGRGGEEDSALLQRLALKQAGYLRAAE